MKTLGELLEGAKGGAHGGLPITGVSLDSRTVKRGELFFAVSGAKIDGRSFIPAAFAAGAAAAVVEGRAVENAAGPVIVVDDIRRSCGIAAARFYGDPAAQLLSIGVTGTNGKTSVTWILSEVLARLGAPAVHVGTLGMRLVSKHSESQLGWREIPNTSPDPILFQSFLAEGLERGARAAVSEVTSQGLLQGRTAGVAWDAAVFTNLTRDHLDLHGSMEVYGSAKARLFFDELAGSDKRKRIAVINCADAFGIELIERLRREYSAIATFAFSPSTQPSYSGVVDSVLKRADCSLTGTEIEFALQGATVRLRSQLIGAFNVENLMAAATTLLGLGYSAREVAEGIAEVPQVPGRLELAKAAAVSVVVDYAHTPDALIKAQRSLREIGRGRLITVFGCGGDRDRGKRPLMGAAVAEHSDVAVVTSDNPRSEDPQTILEDVLPGISIDLSGDFRCRRVYALPDRRAAVREAIQLAVPGDTVLVAGKGHEDYQEVKGIKHPFSDIDVCRELIDELLPSTGFQQE